MSFALAGFVQDKEASYRSPRTIKFYVEKLRRFLAYIDEQSVARTSQLTIHHVRAYMEHARQAGMSAALLHCEARAIRTFLRWMAFEDLIDPRVPGRLKMPRLPKVLVKPFTLAQVEQLLAATKRSMLPERDYAILLLFLDTGIRAQELCDISDDDLGPGRVLIHGKGSKERWVPLSPRTKRAIWGYQKRRGESPDGWLFLSRTHGQLRYHTISQLFNRLAEETGIEGVRVSAHTCRHTVALEAIRDGMGPFELRKLLGHESLAMTNRYVAMDDSDVARAHRAHSLVDKLSRGRGRGL